MLRSLLTFCQRGIKRLINSLMRVCFEEVSEKKLWIEEEKITI